MPTVEFQNEQLFRDFTQMVGQTNGRKEAYKIAVQFDNMCAHDLFRKEYRAAPQKAVWLR